MSFAFTDENLEKIEALKKRYPSPKALSLPCLWMAQQQEGVISLEAIEAIGSLIGTPPMEVYQVASFYTMFNLEGVGTYHIQLCRTLSCDLCASAVEAGHLRGGEQCGRALYPERGGVPRIVRQCPGDADQ